ncbi:MAG: hypothetical protein K2O10_03240 [Muribaculaceae bacterium]|nr:hypothetical protein [Muribaculaceae bacterium]
MPGELQQKIQRIAAKARIIVERYALMVAERDKALERIALLEAEVHRLQQQIQRQQTEAEYLKVAMTIAPTREDTARARAILSELVREIDLCISELKE